MKLLTSLCSSLCLSLLLVACGGAGDPSNSKNGVANDGSSGTISYFNNGNSLSNGSGMIGPDEELSSHDKFYAKFQEKPTMDSAIVVDPDNGLPSGMLYNEMNGAFVAYSDPGADPVAFEAFADSLTLSVASVIDPVLQLELPLQSRTIVTNRDDSMQVQINFSGSWLAALLTPMRVSVLNADQVEIAYVVVQPVLHDLPANGNSFENLGDLADDFDATLDGILGGLGL